MTASGAAAAIAGLLSVFTAAAPTGVSVFDGDPLDPPNRFLCVAWDESDNATASAVLAPQDSAGQTDNEAVEVANLLTVWSGTATPAQIRADVFALYDTFRAAIKADAQLGGAVGRARVSSYEYAPARRLEGFLGQIRFTVSVSVVTA